MPSYIEVEKILDWYNKRREAFDRDQVSFAIEHLDEDQKVIDPDSPDTIATINQLEGRRIELSAFGEFVMGIKVVEVPETSD